MTTETTLLRSIIIFSLLAAVAFAEPISPVDMWPGKTQANTWVFDFGQQFSATTHIEFDTEPSGPIVVRHGEELLMDRLVRSKLRSGPRYHLEIDSPSLTIDIEPKTFRYVELRGISEAPSVSIQETGPDWPQSPGQLVSDHPLSTIWNISANTVRASRGDVFQVDETTLLTSHDAEHMMEAYLLLTGDRDLAKKSLEAIAAHENFFETGLAFPELLHTYYMHTGDRITTQRLLHDTVLPLMDHLKSTEDENGLITYSIHTFEPATYLNEFDTVRARTEPNMPANAKYLRAIDTTVLLCHLFKTDEEEHFRNQTERREAFQKMFFDDGAKLYRDTPTSQTHSYFSNIYGLWLNMHPEGFVDTFIPIVKERALDCSPHAASMLIRACSAAQQRDLAFALLTHDAKNSWIGMTKFGMANAAEAWHPRQYKQSRLSHPRSVGPINNVVRDVLHLSPYDPGWTRVGFGPMLPDDMPESKLSVHTPRGRIEVVYHPDHGYEISAPPGIKFETVLPAGTPLEIYGDLDMTRRTISSEEREYLDQFGWAEKTGGKRAVWVSVDDQMYRIIEGDEVVWEVRCATATNGTGSQSGSMKTPLGWHSISGKIGSDAPWGQVFRARQPTNEIWTPGGDTKEDLVLTRVLLLDGEEPGKNKGGNVDSRARYIYVHGTNDEERIGEPSSHGCIRLRNDDAITAFNLIEEGAMLLITERAD